MATRTKVSAPRRYSEILAARVCEMAAQGKSLREICSHNGMPSAQLIMKWVQFPDSPELEAFAKRFMEARQIGWMLMGEDIIDLADDASQDKIKKPMVDRNGNPVYVIPPIKDENGTLIKAGVLKYVEVDNPNNLVRAKLKIETRKWLLERVLPKVFGQKVAVEHGISDDLAERLTAAKARLDKLQESLPTMDLGSTATTRQIEGLIDQANSTVIITEGVSQKPQAVDVDA